MHNKCFWVYAGEPRTTFYVCPTAHPTVVSAAQEAAATIENITGGKIEVVRAEFSTVEGKNNTFFTTVRDYPVLKEWFKDECDFVGGSDGFAIMRRKDSYYVFAGSPKGVFFAIHDMLQYAWDIVWSGNTHNEVFKPTSTINAFVGYHDAGYFDLRAITVRGQKSRESVKPIMQALGKNKMSAERLPVYLDWQKYGLTPLGFLPERAFYGEIEYSDAYVKRIVGKIVDYIENNPESEEYVWLLPSVATSRSQNTQEGEGKTAYWRFINQVVKGVVKRYPQTYFFATDTDRSTVESPLDTPLHGNIILELDDGCDQEWIRAWAKRCALVSVHLVVEMKKNTIFTRPNFEEYTEKLKNVYLAGARGISIEIDLGEDYAEDPYYEIVEMYHYILERKLFNFETSAAATMNGYLGVAYGKASEEMWRYFDLCHKAQGIAVRYDVFVECKPIAVDEGYFRKMFKLLDKALERNISPLQRRRIERIKQITEMEWNKYQQTQE